MKFNVPTMGLAVLLVAAGITTSLATAINKPATPQDTSVYLEFTTGWCTGTAVAPHTVLTGTHCTATGSLVSINGRPAQSTAVIDDGHDHSLLTVTATFDHHATIRQRPMEQTEPIRYVGNPAFQRDLYRLGYVEGSCVVGVECLDNLLHQLPPGIDIAGDRAVLLSTPGWAGDSGAGVFDKDGYVVSTISAIAEIAPTLAPMVAFDMQFTREQLEAIR